MLEHRHYIMIKDNELQINKKEYLTLLQMFIIQNCGLKVVHQKTEGQKSRVLYLLRRCYINYKGIKPENANNRNNVH